MPINKPSEGKMESENELVKKFNLFIEKWCGDSFPHLIDSDGNDGERFRQFIILALDTAKQEGIRIGREQMREDAAKLMAGQCYCRDVNNKLINDATNCPVAKARAEEIRNLK